MRLAALAMGAVLSALACAGARAQRTEEFAACYRGAPAGLQLAAGKASSPAMRGAASAKLEAERLSIGVQYGRGDWAPVVAATKEALKRATAALGPAQECLATFLEDAGAAAAASSDLKLAETYYRRALALAPERRETLPYRAAVASALAAVLGRGDRVDGHVQAEAARLRRGAEAAWPDHDPYQAMQSWVGAGPLDPVFLGPTAGAQVQNDIAIRTSVYGQPFGFQLHELHARSLVEGAPDVPPALRETIEHNSLQAAGAFADAQGDDRLRAQVTGRQRDLVAHMRPDATRAEADGERLALANDLRGQGLLDEMGTVLDDIAPATLDADRGTAMSVHGLRAIRSLLAGAAGQARQELRLAEEGPARRLDPARLFVLHHAVLDVLEGEAGQAEQVLAPYVGQDPFGAAHQSQVLRLVAHLAIRAGREADATGALRQALAVTEGTSDGGDEGSLGYGAVGRTRELARSVDQTVTVALDNPGQPALARLAAEAVLRARGSQLALSAQRLRELYAMPLGAEAGMRKLRAVRSRLALEFRAVALFPATPPNWPRLDAVLDREAELEGEFASQAVGRPVRPAVPDIPAIVAGLGGRSAMVAYTAYRRYDALRDALDVAPASAPRIAAVLVRPGQDPRWADLGWAAEVEARVAALRQALGPGADPARPVVSDPAEAERALARAGPLLGPWAADLGELERLVVVPDGALNTVPFAALLLGADRRGPAFSLVASLDDLADRPGPTPTLPVVIASPDFDATSVEAPPEVEGLPSAPSWRQREHYPPLPGTGRELERVRGTLASPEVLAGARASKAALLGVHRPVVLHVATHAGFEPAREGPLSTTSLLSAASNPMLRSSLVLAGANSRQVGQNAVATALELSSLDLDGTELVVLSACETGLGGEVAGEGVFGLRRAFAAAGARRLVFSLWKVEDEATAFLMGSFYDALKAGEDADRALARAQADVRRQTRWEHPYYWAGFILSGEHGPVRLDAGYAPPPEANPGAAEATPFRGEVAWTHKMGAAINASPWVGRSLVISASAEGAIHALDRASGKLAWSFGAGEGVDGQPQAADGRVFLATEEGLVLALEEATGKELWRTRVKGPVVAATAAYGGAVLVAAAHLTSLDAASGERRWEFDPAAGQPPIPIGTLMFRQFGAAPAFGADYLYVGDEAGRLYKLRRDTGEPAWVASLGSGMVAGPILDGPRLVQGTWGGDLVCLDTETGKELWRYRSGNEIDNQIVMSGDVVVVGALMGNALVAIRASDGSMAWRVELRTSTTWALAARGDKFLVGGIDGLWSLDRRTGERKRILSSKVTARPTVADGLVYVGDLDGNVHAIR